MLDPEKKVIELAVRIADLLAEGSSVHDAQTACGLAREIAELRVRKISFGGVDHRLAKNSFSFFWIAPHEWAS
jgi:hypothetical protein